MNMIVFHKQIMICLEEKRINFKNLKNLIIKECLNIIIFFRKYSFNDINEMNDI